MAGTGVAALCADQRARSAGKPQSVGERQRFRLGLGITVEQSDPQPNSYAERQSYSDGDPKRNCESEPSPVLIVGPRHVHQGTITSTGCANR